MGRSPVYPAAIRAGVALAVCVLVVSRHRAALVIFLIVLIIVVSVSSWTVARSGLRRWGYG